MREGGGRSALGRSGEDAALRVYLGRGFHPVARNWRCRAGEIDLVVARGGLLVFCEVKSRSSGRFGGGYDAVTARKQRKLRQLAELFLLSEGCEFTQLRLDVASVLLRSGRRPEVEVFADAF